MLLSRLSNTKNRIAVDQNHSVVASRHCPLKSAIACWGTLGRNHQILGRNTQDKLTTPLYSGEMDLLLGTVITLAVSTLVIAWIVWRETR